MKMPGSNIYNIEYADIVLKKHIPKLSATAKIQIKAVIEQRLTLDPIGFGKPLRYSLKGHRRLRVGDYRVIFRIEAEKKVVVIIAIKHREDVYEI